MKRKEPKILQDLETIEQKEEKSIKKLIRGPRFKIALLFIVLIAASFAIIYLIIVGGRVAVEDAKITAPVITLTSPAVGILEKVYVKEGDIVSDGMILARVGNYSIRAKTYGIVIGVTNTPGSIVSAQSSIITMIDPTELRVVGKVQENKGLSKIKPGQKVVFTVDAFGSKSYKATIESIAQTSHQSDIVFSISDKRAEQDFDVKAKFDINDYPELKNGMSARMWIYQ